MMSMKQQSGCGGSDKCCSSEGSGKVVVVAVKASREVPRAALVWALTHVVQPGDCVKLLVLISPHSTGKKLWAFSRFTSDCTISHWRSISGMSSDQKDDIADSCSQMMCQLRDVYDLAKIKGSIKVVHGSSYGIVVDEAKKAQSNWVILDKNMKHETKCCLEELQCNLVVMKRSHPKVLRLNLVGTQKKESEVSSFLPLDLEGSPSYLSCKDSELSNIRGLDITPSSSPDHDSSITGTDVGTSSLSSSDPGTSPFLFPGFSGNIKAAHPYIIEGNEAVDESETDSEKRAPIKKLWKEDTHSSSGELSGNVVGSLPRTNTKALSSAYGTLLGKFSKLKRNSDVDVRNHKPDVNLSNTVRKAVSLTRKAPPGPPPLCTVCQHKGPIFGSPPRWFTYSELEVATRGFSESNFLAEGGFGSVHKGVLPGGQVIAVKQHNLSSSQGDREFCSEVEVLSCAQHRNVVMLIGFCVEDGKRLLVYEFICNGSLHSHLYGREQNPLVWSARQKVAVGAARGLRYLHEECRVGCIVHRDLRPKNILVTHDFEPLVGDFGLARWQPNGDLGVETRIIGTFGYLAPEYAQSGQITEKADVYSFGVILVELITGRKAMDIKRPKGQQCLSEWARPLLAKRAIDELIDPRLSGYYSEEEVYNMMQCASLCIRRDPNVRPRMSQALRMLEGAAVINLSACA